MYFCELGSLKLQIHKNENPREISASVQLFAYRSDSDRKPLPLSAAVDVPLRPSIESAASRERHDDAPPPPPGAGSGSRQIHSLLRVKSPSSGSLHVEAFLPSLLPSTNLPPSPATGPRGDAEPSSATGLGLLTPLFPSNSSTTNFFETHPRIALHIVIHKRSVGDIFYSTETDHCQIVTLCEGPSGAAAEEKIALQNLQLRFGKSTATATELQATLHRSDTSPTVLREFTQTVKTIVEQRWGTRTPTLLKLLDNVHNRNEARHDQLDRLQMLRLLMISVLPNLSHSRCSEQQLEVLLSALQNLRSLLRDAGQTSEVDEAQLEKEVRDAVIASSPSASSVIVPLSDVVDLGSDALTMLREAHATLGSIPLSHTAQSVLEGLAGIAQPLVDALPFGRSLVGLVASIYRRLADRHDLLELCAVNTTELVLILRTVTLVPREDNNKFETDMCSLIADNIRELDAAMKDYCESCKVYQFFAASSVMSRVTEALAKIRAWFTSYHGVINIQALQKHDKRLHEVLVLLRDTQRWLVEHGSQTDDIRRTIDESVQQLAVLLSEHTADVVTAIVGLESNVTKAVRDEGTILLTSLHAYELRSDVMNPESEVREKIRTEESASWDVLLIQERERCSSVSVGETPQQQHCSVITASDGKCRSVGDELRTYYRRTMPRICGCFVVVPQTLTVQPHGTICGPGMVIEAVMAERRFALVEAPMGSGKSMLLHSIAAGSAFHVDSETDAGIEDDQRPSGNQLPLALPTIILRLTDVGSQFRTTPMTIPSRKDLVDIALRSVAEDLGVSTLSDTSVLWLCDGLDEALPLAAKCAGLAAVIAEVCGCPALGGDLSRRVFRDDDRFIVASRPERGDAVRVDNQRCWLFPKNAVTMFVINRWTAAEVSHLCTQLVQTRTISDAEDAAELTEVIASEQCMADLAAHPIACRITLEAYSAGGHQNPGRHCIPRIPIAMIEAILLSKYAEEYPHLNPETRTSTFAALVCDAGLHYLDPDKNRLSDASQEFLVSLGLVCAGGHQRTAHELFFHYLAAANRFAVLNAILAAEKAAADTKVGKFQRQRLKRYVSDALRCFSAAVDQSASLHSRIVLLGHLVSRSNSSVLIDLFAEWVAIRTKHIYKTHRPAVKSAVRSVLKASGVGHLAPTGLSKDVYLGFRLLTELAAVLRTESHSPPIVMKHFREAFRVFFSAPSCYFVILHEVVRCRSTDVIRDVVNNVESTGFFFNHGTLTTVDAEHLFLACCRAGLPSDAQGRDKLLSLFAVRFPDALKSLFWKLRCCGYDGTMALPTSTDGFIHVDEALQYGLASVHSGTFDAALRLLRTLERVDTARVCCILRSARTSCVVSAHRYRLIQFAKELLHRNPATVCISDGAMRLLLEDDSEWRVEFSELAVCDIPLQGEHELFHETFQLFLSLFALHLKVQKLSVSFAVWFDPTIARFYGEQDMSVWEYFRKKVVDVQNVTWIVDSDIQLRILRGQISSHQCEQNISFALKSQQSSEPLNVVASCGVGRKKVVVVGKAACGKTSWIASVTGEPFKATIGMEFKQYKEFQLWDTHGQDSLRHFVRWILSVATFAVLVCVDCRTPAEEVKADVAYWHANINATSPHAKQVLVFTKADLLEGDDELRRCDALASAIVTQYNLHSYAVTSAKAKRNVLLPLDALSRDICGPHHDVGTQRVDPVIFRRGLREFF